MTDFDKKLEEATSRIHENVQQKKNAADAQRQNQIASKSDHEKRIGQAHGVALRFTQKYIEPLINKIHRKIPSGTGREHSNEHGFAGWSLEFDETEYLALKIHFDERSVWLSAEASCYGSGIVYSEKSEAFDSAQFDENKARDWIESRALEAYQAFGHKAKAVRNRPPIVTYDGTEPT